ncbi:MAG: hypothetical protein KAS73_06270 [Candidatus Sabulitectum sp.]|nr:hypothetical protein [Candidatus Sabulitectum sp.]
MSSEQTMNPNVGVCNRRGVEELSSNSQLLERILTPENVQKAWKRVRANKGVPGVDGINVDEFSEFLCEKWSDIRQSILEGSYVPSPVLRVEIPKPDSR